MESAKEHLVRAADSPQQHSQWTLELGDTPASELMKPTRDSTAEQQSIERMYVLCAVEMLGDLIAAECTKPHFERYRSWLVEEFELYKNPQGVPLVPDSAAIVAMSSDARRKAIAEYRDAAQGTMMAPVMESAWRVFSNIVDIVEGRKKLMKILVEDDLLEKFYDWANSLTDPRPLFRLLGSKRPGLRILEVGAGTGGTTARALEGLTSQDGKPLYNTYTYTDITNLFFPRAEKRLAAYSGLECRVLDISKDPVQQGFEPGSYDVVVASNVLHATPNLVETLTNCRTLLKPDGYLFLQELSPPGKFIQFVVGLLPGWWLGDADGRANGPCVPPEEWDVRLRMAGFKGVHAVSYDNESFDKETRCYYNANILARPQADS